MADTPILTGTNFHVEIIFTSGPVGWSESYWANALGGDNPQLAVANVAQTIISARRTRLPVSINIAGLRVSEDGLPGKALVAAPPQFGLGTGAVPGTVSPINLGWLTRAATAENSVDNRQTIRGWIDTDIDYSITAGLKVTPPARPRNWAVAMSNILSSTVIQDGTTVQWVLRSFIKPTLLAGLVPFTKVEQANNGVLNFTILNAFQSRFTVGGPVKIGVKRQRCLKGLSGYGQLVSRTVGDTTTVLGIKKKFCCGAEELLNVVGTLFPVDVAFYKIATFTIQGQGSRKAGRTFFVPAGRQSSRCC